MGIIKSIIAFFNFNGQKIEMEIASARLRNGKAFLQPVSQEKSLVIKADRISITIDNASDEDVSIIEPNGNAEKEHAENGNHTDNDNSEADTGGKRSGNRMRQANGEDIHELKKSFSTGFYESERQEIVTAYKSVGAKRDEFILACIRAASVRNVERELKRIRKERDSMQDD